MSWLGLDIGGANLKLAASNGHAMSVPFALWREPERLEAELRRLLAEAPPADHVAITMTAELCDCFASKEQGVRHILEQAERGLDGRHARVYAVDGTWRSITAAHRAPRDVAAANWHALAQHAVRWLPAGREGTLVDIGSTTTDVIRLGSTGPRTTSRTDLQRLLAGELLYRGVIRTPIAAMIRRARYRQQTAPLAAETFATMRDVHLLLGDLLDDPRDLDTADGRPATRAAALDRVARMLCADRAEFHYRDAVRIAEDARAAHWKSLLRCLAQVHGGMNWKNGTLIVSGVGEFVMRRLLTRVRPPPEYPAVYLSELLGARVSAAAPAYAVAVLAEEFHRDRGAG